MSADELRRAIREALRVDPRKARPLVERYARQAAGSKDPFRVAEARFERAQLDQIQGRLRAAARGYEAARRGFERKGARGQLLAAYVGALQVHAFRGRADAARGSARAARRLASGPVQAAGLEIAVGSSLDSLGDESGAEACFRRALALLRGRRAPVKVRFLRAAARHNLGIRLARRGAVGEALAELDAALAFFASAGMDAEADLARHNRGWARAVAGRAAEALEDLRAAHEAHLSRGNRRLAGLARADEAELLLRLGDAAGAAARAREATRLLAGAGAALEAARALLVAARAEGGGGPARRARAAFRAAGDAAGEALAATLLGEDLARAEATLLARGHAIGALDALLARARAATSGARLLERRVPLYPPVLRRWVLPELHRLRARGRRRIPMLRRAVRAAEDLRGRAPTGSLRASLLAANLGAYEELAAALLDRGGPRDRREAFLVVDAARARTLREEVEREAPGVLDRPPVRRLRERLEALWRALERNEGQGGLRALEARVLEDVAASERELMAALAEAEASGAGAAASARLPRQRTLAFAVAGGRLFGLLGRGGVVDAWPCGGVAEARRDLDALRFQVARRLHGSADGAAAGAALERLGRRLLGGAPGAVTGPDLRVVLPAELGSLPVEALPVDGRPLLETTAVTYAPAACGTPRAWRRGGRALVVGIGNGALPEVAREIATVRRRIGPADLLAGPRATREAILGALRGRRVVHLAGHARAREDLPPLSALRVEDGWLAAADLGGAGLRRALVVLSACRTGDPALRFRGETMGGFPRALLAAGAAGVVASRWEVPDAVAHAWMRAFYDGLDGGAAPEAALARAALNVRRTHPHPADWAAFLLVQGVAL